VTPALFWCAVFACFVVLVSINWPRLFGWGPYRYRCCMCRRPTALPPNLVDEKLYRSVCVDCTAFAPYSRVVVPVEDAPVDELRIARQELEDLARRMRDS
jgi:hypothetical protein